MDPLIPPEIDTHDTELYDESARLASDGLSRIESIRTKEIIGRYLSDRGVKILDVGGGAGVYSVWLTSLGHDVTLVDPVALHVQQARAAGAPTTVRGRAERLGFPDDTYEVVLLLGPLYHLQEQEDRLTALAEARRVLETGGLLFAAGITRYASAIDGFDSGFTNHEFFERIVHVDLETGRHSNPNRRPPVLHDELADELASTGFTEIEILALEGVSWAAQDLEERLDEPDKLRAVLDLLRRLESEMALLGATPHFLAIGMV